MALQGRGKMRVMMTLYDCAFSPFARKVRMVLEHKGLKFDAVWRGDRIEWLLARGYHDWFFNEIKQGRVLWPGPALPAPIKQA